MELGGDHQEDVGVAIGVALMPWHGMGKRQVVETEAKAFSQGVLRSPGGISQDLGVRQRQDHAGPGIVHVDRPVGKRLRVDQGLAKNAEAPRDAFGSGIRQKRLGEVGKILFQSRIVVDQAPAFQLAVDSLGLG